MFSIAKVISVSSLSAFSFVLTGLVQNAQAAVVYESTPFQTLALDSANPNNVGSNTSVVSEILDEGTWYKFVVSGLWSPDKNFADRGEIWQVDARFVTRNLSDWTDQDASFGDFDFGLFSQALGGGNDDFWGNYRSDHTYTFEFLGQGQAVDFYVNDIFSASAVDNAGVYAVNIYSPVTVPEPKTVPEQGVLSAVLLSGLMMLRYGKRGQKD
jgi:hypothetical protein